MIDPVLDYEPVGSRLWTGPVDVEGDKQYLKIPVNIFRPEPGGELELNDV